MDACGECSSYLHSCKAHHFDVLKAGESQGLEQLAANAARSHRQNLGGLQLQVKGVYVSTDCPGTACEGLYMRAEPCYRAGA